MRLGISGLSTGNNTGLGRLARQCIVAIAESEPNWNIHVYFRSPIDLEAVYLECDRHSRQLTELIVPHYPPVGGLNRLLLEDWDLPRQFAPLDLDAYLGCDFTLPVRKIARREIVMIPDMLPFTRPQTVSWRARWLYRRGIQRSVSRGAGLVCISQATASALKSEFSTIKQTHVVYPAVSPALWRKTDSTGIDHALQVRGSLATLQNPGPFILAVGVLGPRKNTALLVRLFEELVLEGSYRGSLVLVGGDGRFHTAPRTDRVLAPQTVGTPMSDTTTSAEVYDIGRVSDYDLSQLYSSADLLANLSSEEGFGYPVAEAIVHGTPAFATRGTSMEEIAPAGIITTSLNRDECLNRLKSTLASLELLRREVRSLDLEQYSIERLGRELKEIICSA